MQRLILLFTVWSFAGCTTLHPIEGSPIELQRQINSSHLLKAGDRVLIVTTDSSKHAFRVTQIDSGVINGRATAIPVEQVASLSKREFSAGKTATLVVLGLLAAAGLVVIAAAHAVPAYALQ